MPNLYSQEASRIYKSHINPWKSTYKPHINPWNPTPVYKNVGNIDNSYSVLQELIQLALEEGNYQYVVDVCNTNGLSKISTYDIKDQLHSLPASFLEQINFKGMNVYNLSRILFKAVEANDFEKVKILVDKGADPYNADWWWWENKTPYEIALEREESAEGDKILKLFKSKPITVKEKISGKLTTLRGDSLPGDDLYKAMAKALEDHNLVDVKKLIIFAENQNRWDTAHKFLFKSKIAKESREVNILEAAAFSSWPGLCRIIEHGNIRLEGYKSNIPNFSFLGTLMDNVDSAAGYVRTLIAHGADVNAPFKRFYSVDRESRILITPLQAAIDLGDPRIIQVLKDAGADFTVKVKASGAFSGVFYAKLTANGHLNDEGWIHFKGEGISLTEYAQLKKDYSATRSEENYKIDRTKVLAAVTEASGAYVTEDSALDLSQDHGIVTMADLTTFNEEEAEDTSVAEAEDTSVAEAVITTDTEAETPQAAALEVADVAAIVATVDYESDDEYEGPIPDNTGPVRRTVAKPVAQSYESSAAGSVAALDEADAREVAGATDYIDVTQA